MHALFILFLPQLLKGSVDDKRAQLDGLLARAIIMDYLGFFSSRLMARSSFIERAPVNTGGIGSGFQI